MELRVLRNFLAVANEGSITAAANSLHLTQPSLSRQIQDLEEELGQKLLQRKSHRVDLTAEGMRFCQRAEEIVALADKTLAEFSAPAGPITGDVYIGCGETHVLHLLAEIAQSIQTEHPQVVPPAKRQQLLRNGTAGKGPHRFWRVDLPLLLGKI